MGRKASSPRVPTMRRSTSLAAVAVPLDFLSKRLAEQHLLPHLPRPVLGDWLRWNLTYNPGAAMNLSAGNWSRPVFTGIALVMLVLIFRMYLGARRDDRLQAGALSMIASGALGNLLDRFRSARGVTDFIDVGWANTRFYTFNVADACVSVGAAWLAILLWRRPDHEV